MGPLTIGNDTMKKFLLRIGDYVFVMRPLILIPAWSFFLVGAAAGRGHASFSFGFSDAPAALFYSFGCLTAILVTAYLLNQVFDVDSDRRNRKGHYLTRGIHKTRTVVAMALVAFILASYFFRFVNASQRVPLAVALALSLAYSLPPLRLVARPIVDLLANAAGYGAVAFISGFTVYNSSITDAAALSLPYVFLVGATFLHTTILDIDGDKQSGKITTTVLVGVRRSTIAAWVLVVFGGVSAALISLPRYGDRLSLVVLSVGFVAFSVAVFRIFRGGGTSVSSNTVQAATVLVTVPAAIAWPAYLVLLVPIVATARPYYRIRFGLNYPGPASAVRNGPAQSSKDV
jgi:4-hydroxybenzoate polyprenyltransferase